MSFQFGNKNKKAKKSFSNKRPMMLESLENRHLLATLVVDSVSDINDGDFSAGNFTLREAISVANLLAGEETITFDTDGVFATPQRIEMSGTELEITESLTIDGTGADQLTIDANGLSRVINITASDGDITLQGLTLTGGHVVGGGSVNRGGAVRIETGSLTVANSVITGNNSQSYGGGIYAQPTADLSVHRSTVSGNSGSWGGGILSYGQTTIESSTISGNSASSGGGGLYVANTHIINSTIADNVAGTGGGGIDVDGGASLTMENTIVAGNSDTYGFPDLRARYGANFAADYSLIGDASSAVITGSGNIIGDASGGGVVDAMLTPLGNYGGPFQTHAQLPGSPALNAGDPAVPFDDAKFDQRGSMFFRVQDGRMDMGAHEDLPTDLLVDNSADVFDGVVSVGQVSLREAIELANLDPGANTISFDTDGAFASSTQIDLSGGPLVISESISIHGPGADRLTIDAGGNSRIFDFAATDGQFTIDGFTLTGGVASVGQGGAIRIAGGEVTVAGTTIVGNFAADTTPARGYGGGIYAPPMTTLTLRNTTVAGNSGRIGGGLMALGNLTMDNSTISGNTATIGGGGIWGVNADIRRSTITDNVADVTTGGGGIHMTTNAGATLNLQDSIVAGNSTVGGNSLPDIDPGSATLAIRYSLIGDTDGILISGSGNILGDSNTAGGIVDPQLAPLADNGGPTPTHALLPTSFAIDEGDRFAVAGADGVPLYDQRGAGFTRVYDGRIDMGAFEFQPSVLPDGDFNDDGLYDCADIDLLVAEIAGGSNAASFDLTGDNIVDLADRDAWLAEAGSVNLASGNAYLPGDANLDGNVDGQDFVAWNSNKFTSTAAWCQGDFNADGNVDGQDFLLWNTNKFASANSRNANSIVDDKLTRGRY